MVRLVDYTLRLKLPKLKDSLYHLPFKTPFKTLNPKLPGLTR